MNKLIIVRYSEIGLKAKNTRRRFEDNLIENIKRALKARKIFNKITRTHDRIFIQTKSYRRSIEVLKRIFGIKSISFAIKSGSKIDSIVETAIQISKDVLKENNSFAVRVNREGKHNYTSQDVAIVVGDAIRKETNAKVNLTKPDFTLFIEIKGKDAFFYTQKVEGAGGLPIGTQGKVLAIINSNASLLSAWYVLKRGCTVKFIVTNKSLIENVEEFAKKWFLKKDIIILEKNKDFFDKINKIISDENYKAVVTNHTLDKKESLEEIKRFKNQINAVILSPLIATNKKEIDKKSKETGLL